MLDSYEWTEGDTIYTAEKGGHASSREILRLAARVRELEERMLNARCGHNKRVAALETRVTDLEAEEERLKAACAELEAKNRRVRGTIEELMAENAALTENLAVALADRLQDRRRARQALLALIEDSPAGPPHLYRGVVDDLFPDYSASADIGQKEG